MTKKELYKALNYLDATREKRGKMAAMVLVNPDLMKPLIEIAHEDKNPISSRACWVLEFVVKQRPFYLFPYLDLFAQNLNKVRLDSSVRPLAKICEILTTLYFSDKEKETQKYLSDVHLERIATAAFDWLIGEYKVASKAYSMTTLYLLGRKFDWIHPELRLVLEQNYVKGSAAYKARARQTLANLNASNLK